MRVSADQVQAALSTSGGNIAQAARVLGIARVNLYKRITSLGLQPAVYRAASPPLSERSGPRRPPAGRLRVCRSYYLRPDQVAAIDDACLDLPVVLRKRMSPSKVLERFVDAAFAEWVARTLAQAPEGRR